MEVGPLWITTQEASKIVGVSDRYLRRLCQQGILDARIRGNTWLISPASFRAWQQERRKRGGKNK